MPFTEIRASNFKSFRELDLKLEDYNLVVGPNNSGKSNFVEIIRFISDILTIGLDGAISRQGGIEYLGNSGLPKSTEIKIEFVYRVHRSMKFPFLDYLLPRASKSFKNISGYLSPESVNYKLGIKHSRNRHRYLITQEYMEVEGELLSGRRRSAASRPVVFGFTRNINKHDILLKYQDVKANTGWQEVRPDEFGPRFLEVDEWEAMINNKHSFFPIFYIDLRDLFGRISVYNIDPRLPKKAVPVIGNNFLEEDGNNLAIVLINILRNRESRELLITHLKDLLPFVENVDVVKILDKSLLFQLKENYGKKKISLPSSLISDGTINILAIIVSLYLQRDDVIVIEEPERNIHPSLISKLVNLLIESSKRRQVIVTTHSPEFIKNSPLKSNILIRRNVDGFSEATRPAEKEMVRAFLKEDIGMDDLFINELLT